MYSITKYNVKNIASNIKTEINMWRWGEAVGNVADFYAAGPGFDSRFWPRIFIA